MEQEKLYRHELKFEIPYADYAAMRRRLAKNMRSDPQACFETAAAGTTPSRG